MLKVGEYGRTNKGQIFIFCYVEQLENETFIMVRRPNKEYVNASCFEKYWLDEDEEIVKHSKNIIDLIEEGDYVNGKKIHSIYRMLDSKGNEYTAHINYGNCKRYENKDIKTILTKELFEANCYKVKEE